MNLKIPVVPEYSYLVSGSFKAEFGTLSPSENLTMPGEIERLMKNPGCHIKYDFKFTNYIESKNSNNQTIETIMEYQTSEAGEKMSSIDCAKACFSNSTCGEGWSYQIATKRCIFYENIDLDVMQPGHSVSEANQTLGWITGLKSCNRAGSILYFNRTNLMHKFLRLGWRMEQMVGST